MPKVFISYRRNDSSMLARFIARELQARQINAYVDILNRDGAGPFPARLRNAIKEADIFVCLLGATTLESAWVRKEIELACRYNKVMIPLFQEMYNPPEEVKDENIRKLLESDGLPIDDIRSVYVDAAIDLLVTLIRDTPNHLLAPVFDGEESGEIISMDLDTTQVTPSVEIGPDPVEQARRLWLSNNYEWVPEIRTFTVHGIDFEMCLVPPGSFQMGNDDYEHEKPVHQQTITEPYWIGLHPVTNMQWRAAVEASLAEIMFPYLQDWYNDRSKDNHPVVGVNWYQCRNFVKWLGAGWHLPTEVQWEYAARGPEGWIYPWGNEFQPELLVYDAPDGSPAEVGGRQNGASWVGAHDMSGNVWEWCLTKWRDNYEIPQDNSPGDKFIDDSERVLRGGSWLSPDYLTRTSTRTNVFPSSLHESRGFRLCYIPTSHQPPT